MAAEAGCTHSISCTTRPPREGEINGQDYHFLSMHEFEEKIAMGEFLEYARVHDHLYGTLKSSVLECLHKGTDVLMDVDVQGAALIRNCNDAAIQVSRSDVFVLPPSMSELESRLRGRKTETEAELRLRINNANVEMQCWPAYQYTLISRTPEEDFARLAAIIEAERMRSSRLLSAKLP